MNCSFCATAGAAKAVAPSAAAATIPTSFVVIVLSLEYRAYLRGPVICSCFQDAGHNRSYVDFARVLAAPQYGNGHNLSFSFAVAHSRASPLGSTIRKKTIIAPNTMNSMWEIVAVEIGIPSSVGS